MENQKNWQLSYMSWETLKYGSKGINLVTYSDCREHPLNRNILKLQNLGLFIFILSVKQNKQREMFF